jgi:xylulokinase
MNLMDIDSRTWDDQLVGECGGDELRSKLGDEPVEGGKSLGGIGRWWQERFGFEAGECRRVTTVRASVG